MKKAILTVVAMTLAIIAFADKKDDYRRFTDTIRAEVYAMDLPAFNTKDVPEKYRGESVVIKAIYGEVNARKKPVSAWLRDHSWPLQGRRRCVAAN